MQLNAEDGGNRSTSWCNTWRNRWKSEAFKAGYKTILILVREIRRSGEKIKAEIEETNASSRTRRAKGTDIGLAF